MSVRDFNKVVIVSDALNGDIIDNISLDTYCNSTIGEMLHDIIGDYIFNNEHGLLIKVGYKNS